MMTRSSLNTVFVQFPQPGREHNPGRARRQPWNRGQHGRKFLRSDGHYVARDNSLHGASLVLWGEWEPPSYVIKEWTKNGALPRFLQEPVWEYPKGPAPRQNSDPWVFGDCFRYSNCKQASQQALRNLAPGSVILFGSSVGGSFVVDTAFVVKDSRSLLPAESPEMDDAFRVCTVESLLTDAECGGGHFTLYRGATYEDQINDMYSFVPCRLANSEERRFCRPAITLPTGYINPSSTQSPSNAGIPRSVSEVRAQWESVRKQVLDARCLLGVSFSTPRLDDDRIGPQAR